MPLGRRARYYGRLYALGLLLHLSWLLKPLSPGSSWVSMLERSELIILEELTESSIVAGGCRHSWMDGRIDEPRDACLSTREAVGTMRTGIDERMPPREEFAQLKSEEELSISLTDKALPLSTTMRRR